MPTRVPTRTTTAASMAAVVGFVVVVAWAASFRWPLNGTYLSWAFYAALWLGASGAVLAASAVGVVAAAIGRLGPRGSLLTVAGLLYSILVWGFVWSAASAASERAGAVLALAVTLPAIFGAWQAARGFADWRHIVGGLAVGAAAVAVAGWLYFILGSSWGDVGR